MAIRNGKDGDIVYLNNGAGPRAQITGKREIPFYGVHYSVKILEDHYPWEVGDKSEERAKSLSRKKVKDGTG